MFARVFGIVLGLAAALYATELVNPDRLPF